MMELLAEITRTFRMDTTKVTPTDGAIRLTCPLHTKIWTTQETRKLMLLLQDKYSWLFDQKFVLCDNTQPEYMY
jgi:hypothetical protein